MNSVVLIAIHENVARSAMVALRLMGECFLRAKAELPDHEGPRVRNVLGDQVAQSIAHAFHIEQALTAPPPPEKQPAWLGSAKAHLVAITDLVDSAQKTFSVEDYGDALASAQKRLGELQKLLEGGV